MANQTMTEWLDERYYEEKLANLQAEIEQLTLERDKALTEIGRLRVAFRVNMLRVGHKDADIDAVLKVVE